MQDSIVNKKNPTISFRRFIAKFYHYHIQKQRIQLRFQNPLVELHINGGHLVFRHFDSFSIYSFEMGWFTKYQLQILCKTVTRAIKITKEKYAN